MPGGGSARDLADFGGRLGATRAVTYLADADGRIAQRYGVSVIDTVIVIDPRGRVRARMIRPSRSQLRSALAAIPA